MSFFSNIEKKFYYPFQMKNVAFVKKICILNQRENWIAITNSIGIVSVIGSNNRKIVPFVEVDQHEALFEAVEEAKVEEGEDLCIIEMW